MIFHRLAPSLACSSMIRISVAALFCSGLMLPLVAEKKDTDEKPDSKSGASSSTDEKKGTSGGKSADKNPKDDTEARKNQYRKNASPSGLLIGLEDSKEGKGLPENVQELAKEGALASANKDWKKASDAYARMVKAAPSNALALANLGIVEYRLKEYKNAAKHLEASVKINPRMSQNWLTLGLSYYFLKEFNLAISSLTRAKHEDPKDPRTCLYLAVVIRDYGWGQAAETELMRAIALDPDYADAHFNLALLYLERTPPPIEMARRHYFFAIDLGAPRDEEIEKRLKKIDDSNSKK